MQSKRNRLRQRARLQAKGIQLAMLLLIMALLLASCRTVEEMAGTPMKETEEHAAKETEEQSAKRPEGQANSPMPAEMPDDFAFAVQYGVTSKNRIDTFEHRVTKDLVSDGTADAELQLSREELESIYAKMREMNVTGLANLNVEHPSCQQIPYTDDSWTIRLGGKQYYLAWTGKYCELTQDAKSLQELRDYIAAMVQKKEAYKQLPTARGGYD
ncbi:hypothetical protein [Paenibacillus protaetiae]|uniref:Uncharacterized protein n=1 Tax=Paenibacillus protaetiae TaxID=2509456 RepID=A0A4P6ESA4_9BACL|nr:hypothetical protein [Paenibacillus protaetiae]QAY65315.1 hypothetical protein ET464_01880 [Paenibacillus protaetiae]